MQRKLLNLKKLKNSLIDKNINPVIGELRDNIRRLTGGGILLGAELEFSYFGNIKNLHSKICNDIILNNLIFDTIFKEEGANQYEIKFRPQDDPLKFAQDILYLKNKLINIAGSCDEKIDFGAKSELNEPGNSLHIHLNLFDQQQKNLFCKNGENESITMLNVIAGLCRVMSESMIFFQGNKEDYKRIEPFYNSPTKVSWGGNNRTVALRIPCTGKLRRIEHRLSSANCHPHLAIMAILIGVDYGLKNRLIPKEEKIYGNAYDDKYNLVELPNSLLTAARKLKESEIILPYLQYLFNEQKRALG